MALLKKYKQKRDFTKTAEPVGKKVRKRQLTKKASGIFVIQQHAARAMHYDLRLEIGGVLVSWAVPKGPSLNPARKRLAVMTEDHPLAYATFEGIIPAGEYGGGVVIVWDKGTYINVRKKNDKVVSMSECLQEGHIEFFAQGKKIYGNYALIRTDATTVEKSKWLLIKMRDEYADARKNITISAPESVKTGKTVSAWKKEAKKRM